MGREKPRPVISFEDRHRAEGIDGAKRVAHLLFFPEIDLNGLDLVMQIFFGNEHAHEARAGGGGAIIELHGEMS